MENLEDKLQIGTKIKIGKEYSKHSNFNHGDIIELIEGEFEYDNGLYTEIQKAPSIWNDRRKEFDSIYYLFGNDLEDFEDCEIIN